ncbi:MAG TPA: GWxTD domain-containing protein [Cyclobacteriaceae bacterium]|nr:GWxTD domain-containing protein [Cyclobacteriaceae bacterium]
MRRLLIFSFAVAFSRSMLGQSIAASNFNYWYSPLNEVELQLRPVRSADKIMVRYTLVARNGNPEKYSITWEARNSYVEREGVPVREKDSVLSVSGKDRRGFISFNIPEKPWLLLGHVTSGSRSWTYFKQIESIYPVDGWIETSDGVITENHLSKNKEYVARSANGKPLIVSYYNKSFAPALPPFAEKEGRNERFFFHDSVFRVESGARFLPKKEGLYLFQEDTTAARGFSYRVVKENFPKFTKINELVPPLVLVTTQEEFADLSNAKGEKAKFDKTILNITGDKDRARVFMKNFFHNIELANVYFSSYKEGWKTDRGMMYLIFGLPDEVSKNTGNEIWTYKNLNAKFTFVRSGSVYDPENYVLLRDKRFTDAWFSVVDLWRKGRFQ